MNTYTNKINRTESDKHHKSGKKKVSLAFGGLDYVESRYNHFNFVLMEK